MCGIVGAVSAAPIDPSLVASMRDRLAHRGPDHAGLWLAHDGRVGLGHRRLAIVDLTPEANQPFCSHDGRYVLTFNGEIYNHQHLRGELQARGVAFRTRSDTEVLVEAYRRWGKACVAQLSGMFAFAIWDRHERRLFCARDRVGEKPFHYTSIDGSFVFASELKALALWPGFRRALHYPALIDFLSLGYVADPKCIWEGSHKLAPGHWIDVQLPANGAPVVGEPVAYWDWQFDPDYAVRDWGAPVRETLAAASKEMAFADVPVGSFLSGGVDSSSVTAALSHSGCAVKTFTVGFAEEGYDERDWARRIVDRYHTDHSERLVGADDVVPVMERLLWHYDEPFNDYSYLPTYYLCREARQDVTVALSGDGADELFGGYGKYRRLAMRQRLQRFLPGPLLPAIARSTALLPSAVGAGRRWASHATDTRTMLVDMLTLASPVNVLRAAARGPLAEALRHYTPRDTIAALLRQAPPEKVGAVNAMRYLDLKLTLAGDILVKVDRASMAVALEVRPVYLHRDMLALASRIPAPLLASRSQSKAVLKAAFEPWLPSSLLYRQKMGFALPLPAWMDGGLRELFGPDARHGGLDDLFDTQMMATMAPTAAVRHSQFLLSKWLAVWAAAPSSDRHADGLVAAR
jgi:asparagine synthase (glutamine-hydrolysing)